MALTSDQALDVTNKLYSRLNNRRTEVDEFDRYFRGESGRLRFGTKEWADQHAERFRNFSDNWCGVVGSAGPERKSVDGFRLGNLGAQPTDVEKQLWNDWDINEMATQSSQGFLASSIAKRSAVLVWGNSDDEPVATWEHPSQVAVAYDPATREPLYAVKSWCDDDRELATLYTREDVWKWERSRTAAAVVTGRTESGLYVSTSDRTLTLGGGWIQRELTGDDTWPLKHPMGILPIQEFQNRPMLGGEPLSDIAGAMAMQDAINLLWAYLFVAADYASMPARVVMGLEPPKMPILDENGQKIGEKPVDQEDLRKGRLLWLTGQGGSIGQWDAAKLDVFTQVIQVQVKHVAAQTKTPIFLVHGELGNVNGETLSAMESALNGKVHESNQYDTGPVRGIFRRFALVRGDKALADACRTGRVQWANPATRSEAQLADAALKDKNIGWSFEGILERRYGLSQPEIERELARRRAEAEDPILQAALKDVATQPAATPAVPDAPVV